MYLTHFVSRHRDSQQVPASCSISSTGNPTAGGWYPPMSNGPPMSNNRPPVGGQRSLVGCKKKKNAAGWLVPMGCWAGCPLPTRRSTTALVPIITLPFLPVPPWRRPGRSPACSPAGHTRWRARRTRPCWRRRGSPAQGPMGYLRGAGGGDNRLAFGWLPAGVVRDDPEPTPARNSNSARDGHGSWP